MPRMNTQKPRQPPSAAGTAARQVVANPFDSDPVARRYARAPLLPSRGPGPAEDTIHIPLTRSELADYLLTQSNAATAIESGAISANTLRNQILSETAAFYASQRHPEAVFGIRVWTTIRRG